MRSAFRNGRLRFEIASQIGKTTLHFDGKAISAGQSNATFNVAKLSGLLHNELFSERQEYKHLILCGVKPGWRYAFSPETLTLALIISAVAGLLIAAMCSVLLKLIITITSPGGFVTMLLGVFGFVAIVSGFTSTLGWLKVLWGKSVEVKGGLPIVIRSVQAGANTSIKTIVPPRLPSHMPVSAVNESSGIGMPCKAFKFSCPNCDGHIEVEGECAGREFDCPHCGRGLTIPSGLIKFGCPDCNGHIEVNAGCSGREFACPHCGSTLTAP